MNTGEALYTVHAITWSYKGAVRGAPGEAHRGACDKIYGLFTTSSHCRCIILGVVSHAHNRCLSKNRESPCVPPQAVPVSPAVPPGPFPRSWTVEATRLLGCLFPDVILAIVHRNAIEALYSRMLSGAIALSAKPRGMGGNRLQNICTLPREVVGAMSRMPCAHPSSGGHAIQPCKGARHGAL
jgi:hypothetical protein